MALPFDDSPLVVLLDEDTGSGTTSPSVNRALYSEHAIQTVAANAASKVKIQASVDNENWADVTELTGSVLHVLSGCYPYIRMKRSDLTTEALTAKIYSNSLVDY